MNVETEWSIPRVGILGILNADWYSLSVMMGRLRGYSVKIPYSQVSQEYPLDQDPETKSVIVLVSSLIEKFSNIREQVLIITSVPSIILWERRKSFLTWYCWVMQCYVVKQTVLARVNVWKWVWRPISPLYCGHSQLSHFSQQTLKSVLVQFANFLPETIIARTTDLELVWKRVL